jgi:hypothetical protein
MRRTNTSKNEEPIRTPIVRPQDISSLPSDNRIKGKPIIITNFIQMIS